MTDRFDRAEQQLDSGETLVGGVSASRTAFWSRGTEPVELSDEEWWLTRLCGLRNAIVHGDEISSDLWMHESKPHLQHMHDGLVQALRIVVADAVNDWSLRLPLGERVFQRPLSELERRRGNDAEG